MNIYVYTGLRVLCSLKLFSSMDDWSLESLSFFLHLLLLLLLLSESVVSTLSWSKLMASPFGQSSNAKSRHFTGLFSFCLPFFGTCPPIPSPKHSPVMHSSASSILRERVERRGWRIVWWSIVKRESWVCERGGFNTDFIVGFGLGHTNSNFNQLLYGYLVSLEI